MAQVSTGFIVNLITNDSERFLQACIFVPFVVIGPVMLLAATLLVYNLVGWPAFCGFAFLVLTIPLYLYIGHKLKTLRNDMSVITDRRVKIMSEVLGGMRVLKMNGWITPFGDLLKRIRVEELGKIREISLIKVSAAMVLFFIFLSSSCLRTALLSWHLVSSWLL
jgi:ABC-type multidrug transport system fused ATPase/permease subunit